MVAQGAIVALFGSTIVLTMIGLKQSRYFTLLAADPPGTWRRALRWSGVVWTVSIAIIAAVAMRVIQT